MDNTGPERQSTLQIIRRHFPQVRHGHLPHGDWGADGAPLSDVLVHLRRSHSSTTLVVRAPRTRAHCPTLSLPICKEDEHAETVALSAAVRAAGGRTEAVRSKDGRWRVVEIPFVPCLAPAVETREAPEAHTSQESR